MITAPDWFLPVSDNYSYVFDDTVILTNVHGGCRSSKSYSNPTVSVSATYLLSREKMILWLEILERTDQGEVALLCKLETGDGFLKDHTAFIVPDSIQYNYSDGGNIIMGITYRTKPELYNLTDEDVDSWLALYEGAFVQYEGNFPLDYSLVV